MADQCTNSYRVNSYPDLNGFVSNTNCELSAEPKKLLESQLWQKIGYYTAVSWWL